MTVIAAGFDSGRPSSARTPAPPAMPGAVGGVRAARPACSPHRRPVGAHDRVGHRRAGTGERLAVGPQRSGRAVGAAARPAARGHRRPPRPRRRAATAAASPCRRCRRSRARSRAAVRCRTRTSRRSSTSPSSSRGKDRKVRFVSTAPAAPSAVRPRRVVTDRRGGRSRAPYDSFNLGDHVGDDPAAVAANRDRRGARARRRPGTGWSGCTQVHGTGVAVVDGPQERPVPVVDALVTADARGWSSACSSPTACRCC